MKKRITIIALIVILAFSFALPTAFAADMRGTALWIDGKSQYGGHERLLSGGYSPPYPGNGAHSPSAGPRPGNRTGENGEQVNISVGLGDPKTAPFIFNNYDTAVSLKENKLADGKTKESYLVDLSLPLAENRVNGNYPVVVTAKYPLMDGTVKTQEFTVFVKVTDGQDPLSRRPNQVGSRPVSRRKTWNRPGNRPGIDPGAGGGGGGASEFSAQGHHQQLRDQSRSGQRGRKVYRKGDAYQHEQIDERQKHHSHLQKPDDRSDARRQYQYGVY